jgi:hypothetical protein
MIISIVKRIINSILELKNDYLYNKKIKHIYRLQKNKFRNNNPTILIEHREKWSQLSKKVNTKWLLVYSQISGIESPNYVPENVYYNIIERRLNNRIFTTAYSDKNFYDIYFSEEQLFPLTILRCVNNVLYDAQYNSQPVTENNLRGVLNDFDKVIVKPANDSGGGRRVELFIKEKDKLFYNANRDILNFEYLEKKYYNTFIIQEYIEQHEFYRQFNPSSTNTVRIFTYRTVSSEDIVPLHAVLRIGRPGSIVDNQAAGGISCGITNEGKLNDFAVDKHGNVFKAIESIKFSDMAEVLGFRKMIECIKSIAPKLFYSRINGFDFCVDKNLNIRLLEINSKNIEINFMQMNTGPLFKEYTDEVIDFCRENPKSVCLDFYV